VLVEVKSTNGPFARRLHVSVAELSVMVSEEACHLLRLYNVCDEDVSARLCVETTKVATDILRVLQDLPQGVKADSLSVDPEILEFDAEFLSPWTTEACRGPDPESCASPLLRSLSAVR